MHLFWNNYDQFAFVLLWGWGRGTLKINTPPLEKWPCLFSPCPRFKDIDWTMKTLVGTQTAKINFHAFLNPKRIWLHLTQICPQMHPLLWSDSRSFVRVNQFGALTDLVYRLSAVYFYHFLHQDVGNLIFIHLAFLKSTNLANNE